MQTAVFPRNTNVVKSENEHPSVDMESVEGVLVFGLLPAGRLIRVEAHRLTPFVSVHSKDRNELCLLEVKCT